MISRFTLRYHSSTGFMWSQTNVSVKSNEQDFLSYMKQRWSFSFRARDVSIWALECMSHSLIHLSWLQPLTLTLTQRPFPLYLHALPTTPYPLCLFPLICAPLHQNMFCRVKQSPFQFTAFLILCLSLFLPTIFFLSLSKTHLQIPSMLFSLTSPSIPFTLLLFCSHLLPAIIQFCSFSSCFHCVLYLCFFQTWDLQGAQHQNELKFSDKDDNRSAKVQRQNTCTIFLQH